MKRRILSLLLALCLIVGLLPSVAIPHAHAAVTTRTIQAMKGTDYELTLTATSDNSTITYTKNQEVDVIDATTGEPVLNEDGTKKTEWVQVPGDENDWNAKYFYNTETSRFTLIMKGVRVTKICTYAFGVSNTKIKTQGGTMEFIIAEDSYFENCMAIGNRTGGSYRWSHTYITSENDATLYIDNSGKKGTTGINVFNKLTVNANITVKTHTAACLTSQDVAGATAITINGGNLDLTASYTGPGKAYSGIESYDKLYINGGNISVKSGAHAMSSVTKVAKGLCYTLVDASTGKPISINKVYDVGDIVFTTLAEQHTVSEWTDGKGNCTVCGAEVICEHDYENATTEEVDGVTVKTYTCCSICDLTFTETVNVVSSTATIFGTKYTIDNDPGTKDIPEAFYWENNSTNAPLSVEREATIAAGKWNYSFTIIDGVPTLTLKDATYAYNSKFLLAGAICDNPRFDLKYEGKNTYKYTSTGSYGFINCSNSDKKSYDLNIIAANDDAVLNIETTANEWAIEAQRARITLKGGTINYTRTGGLHGFIRNERAKLVMDDVTLNCTSTTDDTAQYPVLNGATDSTNAAITIKNSTVNIETNGCGIASGVLTEGKPTTGKLQYPGKLYIEGDSEVFITAKGANATYENLNYAGLGIYASDLYISDTSVVEIEGKNAALGTGRKTVDGVLTVVDLVPTLDDNYVMYTSADEGAEAVKPEKYTTTSYFKAVPVEAPACEHDWADATCTAPKTCSKCQATEGDALGHNYGEWIDGKKTCSVCKDVVTCECKEVETKTETTDATCTEDGSVTTTTTCKTCGKVTTTVDPIKSEGHKYGEWIDGKKTCSVCKDVVTCECKEVDTETKTVDATCTEDGSVTTTTTCKTCGKVTTTVEPIKSEGHKYGEWIDGKKTCSVCKDVVTCECKDVDTKTETKDATCTEDGSVTTTTTCKTCGKVTTTVDPIKSKGHTADEPVTENFKDSDLNNEGSYDSVVYCSVCNAELKRETIKIPVKTGAVAEANGVKYYTLAEAVAKANNGDTITLLKSVEGAGIVINKSITIDFGTNTYTFASPAVGSTGTQTLGFQILKSSDKVTLTNGKLAVAEAAKHSFAMMIQNYANLTVDKMELDGTWLDRREIKDYDYSYVLSANGNMTVKDTKIIGNNDGDAYALTVKANVTVDNVTATGNILVNGGELTINSGKIIGNGSNGLIRVEDGNVTINGGTFEATLGADNYSMAVWAKGGLTTIKGGTFKNATDGSERGTDLIYASINGKITIEGGVFEAATPAWTLNQKDGERDTTSITVKGGQFKDFDPANNKAEGEGTTFVADGLHTKRDEKNVYTICKGKHEATVTKPNCVNGGYTTNVCPDCGDEFISDETSALGHTKAEAVKENIKDSDLNNEGSYDSVVKCSVCGAELSRETIKIPVKEGAVAEVNGIKYGTLAEALAAGSEVKLLADVTETAAVLLDKAIILDGQGHTLTSKATRAINVNYAGNVTIKNLTIVGAANTERAINVIQKAATLVVENVTAEGFKYALNVAATSKGSNVTINGGKLGGYAAVNITGDNTTLVVNKAELVGVNDYPMGLTNDFGVISVGDVTSSETTDNVSVTVNGGKLIATATKGNREYAVTVDNATKVAVKVDAELALANGDVFYGDVVTVATAIFPAEYADELAAQGYAALEAETGFVQVHTHTAAEAVTENFKDSDLNNKGSYDSVVYCSVCNAELSRETVETPVKEGAVAEVNGIKYATLQ